MKRFVWKEILNMLLVLTMVIVWLSMLPGCNSGANYPSPTTPEPNYIPSPSIPTTEQVEETPIPIEHEQEEVSAEPGLPSIFQGVAEDPGGKITEAVSLSGEDLESLKKELDGRPIGEKNTFLLDKKEITDITVISIDESMPDEADDSLVEGVGTFRHVRVDALVDRTVAIVDCETDLIYEYSNGAWIIRNVEITPVVKEINLIGLWEGEVTISYVYSKAEMKKISLRIDKINSDGLFNTTITLSAHTTTPASPTYVYKALGGLDPSTGTITMSGVEWISGDINGGYVGQKPTDIYDSVGNFVIVGVIDLAKKAYVQGDGAKNMGSLMMNRVGD